MKQFSQYTKLINGKIPFDVVGTLDVKSSYGWVVVTTSINTFNLA